MERFLLGVCAAAVGILACIGLTGSSGDVVDFDSLVRGRVTVGGTAVSAGIVTAYHNGVQVTRTAIDPDGGYEFVIPASGEYRLAVSHTDVETPFGPAVSIPARYADPDQSGLRTTAAAGRTNWFDVRLDAQ